MQAVSAILGAFWGTRRKYLEGLSNSPDHSTGIRDMNPGSHPGIATCDTDTPWVVTFPGIEICFGTNLVDALLPRTLDLNSVLLIIDPGGGLHVDET